MSNNTITQAGFRSGVLTEWDGNTFETTVSAAPFQFSDDFVGAGAAVPAAGAPVAGYPWVKKIVGTPTGVALVANGAGGQMACALAATSEAEEASLYFNDNLSLGTTGTQIGAVEWRAQLAVVPTGVAQAFLGLGSAWVGGPLNLARYMGFLWNAGAGLTIAAKDGNGDTYSFAAAPIGGAAITTDATLMHVYRIDWSNPADVAFYVDGNRVNAIGSVVWNPSSAANGVLQPFATIYKASGTGVATLNVDKIDAFANR